MGKSLTKVNVLILTSNQVIHDQTIHIGLFEGKLFQTQNPLLLCNAIILVVVAHFSIFPYFANFEAVLLHSEKKFISPSLILLLIYVVQFSIVCFEEGKMEREAESEVDDILLTATGCF